MKVKERVVAQRKVAAPSLSQLGKLAQLRQQRLELIKVLRRGMPHRDRSFSRG
jgi:hypothetical protein